MTDYYCKLCKKCVEVIVVFSEQLVRWIPNVSLFFGMRGLTTHPGFVAACRVLHPSCFSPAQQMRAEWFAWEAEASLLCFSVNLHQKDPKSTFLFQMEQQIQQHIMSQYRTYRVYMTNIPWVQHGPAWSRPKNGPFAN